MQPSWAAICHSAGQWRNNWQFDRLHCFVWSHKKWMEVLQVVEGGVELGPLKGLLRGNSVVATSANQDGDSWHTHTQSTDMEKIDDDATGNYYRVASQSVWPLLPCVLISEHSGKQQQCQLIPALQDHTASRSFSIHF